MEIRADDGVGSVSHSQELPWEWRSQLTVAGRAALPLHRVLTVGGGAAFPVTPHGALTANTGRARVRGVVPRFPVGPLPALVKAACVCVCVGRTGRHLCSDGPSKCVTSHQWRQKKEAYPRRSGSTPGGWGGNTPRRGRVCADSGPHRRHTRTTDSRQRGGRNAECACRCAPPTHSLMGELENNRGGHMEKSIILRTMQHLLCFKWLPGHWGQQPPGSKFGFEQDSRGHLFIKHWTFPFCNKHNTES